MVEKPWPDLARARHNEAMPQLISPDPRFRTAFLDAVRENVAEGEYFGDTLKRELAVYGDNWQQPDGFVRYVAAIREEELEEGRRPEGFVPSSWFWYVDGDDYLGRIQIRHRFTLICATSAATSATAYGRRRAEGGTPRPCSGTFCRTRVTSGSIGSSSPATPPTSAPAR